MDELIAQHRELINDIVSSTFEDSWTAASKLEKILAVTGDIPALSDTRQTLKDHRDVIQYFKETIEEQYTLISTLTAKLEELKKDPTPQS